MSSTYTHIAILDPTTHIENTQHWPMSSTYTPIAILDPTTHIDNTQHWPHVQWVQSYHYIRSHHPHREHTALTTSPVHTLLIAILDANTQIWNTQHWPHARYEHSLWWSLYYIPTATYGTQNTDHISSMLIPITISGHTTHIHNKQHWPHVQCVQSLLWSVY